MRLNSVEVQPRRVFEYINAWLSGHDYSQVSSLRSVPCRETPKRDSSTTRHVRHVQSATRAKRDTSTNLTCGPPRRPMSQQRSTTRWRDGAAQRIGKTAQYNALGRRRGTMRWRDGAALCIGETAQHNALAGM